MNMIRNDIYLMKYTYNSFRSTLIMTSTKNYRVKCDIINESMISIRKIRYILHYYIPME